MRVFTTKFKTLFLAVPVITLLAGCSTNPATGNQQFTALMSPQQEMNAGAEEHAKVMQTYGEVNDPQLIAYVRSIGQKVAANTERGDVNYSFYVLDDPMVNAFALPGGYVYVTRGLLAQANSEAELAGVLGHEIGHITGRHSAERYSRGVITSLGAAVLSAALDSPTASQALGIGSDLFMKSYSRGQENEADTLGIRYLTRAGYHPSGMAAFLTALEGHSELEGKISGSNSSMPSWFSTHPLTQDRIQKTIAEGKQYAQSGTINGDGYLNMIDGLVYGDSPKQGFVRDNSFYHTGMDFTFTAPEGFMLVNQPKQVIGVNKGTGGVIVFDAAARPQGIDTLTYLTQSWMTGEKLTDAERITINGMNAATASFPGRVDNKAVTIRVVAVEWSGDTVFRFQMAIPQNAPASMVEDYKRTTYSLRRLTAAEKRDIQPYRIRVVKAGSGDTVASLARRMPYKSYQEDRFRALNSLVPGQGIAAGQEYKIISE